MTPVAVQVNLFPSDEGIVVVPYSHYDTATKESTEICMFVIRWHEWQSITDRMASIEQLKIDADSGNSPF